MSSSSSEDDQSSVLHKAPKKHHRATVAATGTAPPKDTSSSALDLQVEELEKQITLLLSRSSSPPSSEHATTTSAANELVNHPEVQQHLITQLHAQIQGMKLRIEELRHVVKVFNVGGRRDSSDGALGIDSIGQCVGSSPSGSASVQQEAAAPLSSSPSNPNKQVDMAPRGSTESSAGHHAPLTEQEILLRLAQTSQELCSSPQLFGSSVGQLDGLAAQYKKIIQEKESDLKSILVIHGRVVQSKSQVQRGMQREIQEMKAFLAYRQQKQQK